MNQFGLANDTELFKKYQYYVSRDIVLTAVSTSSETGIASGQTYSSTVVERDVKNFSASTPGVALKVLKANGQMSLGVAFEDDDELLLEFIYAPQYGEGYFRLGFQNVAKEEIVYGGKTYKVSYGSGTGAAGNTVVVLLGGTAQADPYENMHPILLYKETSVVKETTTRSTASGRKL
jgi:hypothetical protein